LMVIKCPNLKLHGWDLEGLEPFNVLMTSSTSCMNSSSSCNCHPAAYQPVCSGGLQYFTPCQLGCTAVSNNNDTLDDSVTFTNCTCAPDGLDVIAGACTDVGLCNARTALYLIAAFVAAFVGTFFYMAGYTALTRSVARKHKPIALSVANFLMSLLGYIPSQVAYGALIDSTCAHWSSEEDKAGHCLIYRNDQFRRRYHVVTAAVYFIAMLSTTGAWWKSRRYKFHDHSKSKPVLLEMKSFLPQDSPE